VTFRLSNIGSLATRFEEDSPRKQHRPTSWS
jgi:hypothetical protein